MFLTQGVESVMATMYYCQRDGFNELERFFRERERVQKLGKLLC